MTLSTQLRIHEKIDLDNLWNKCREITGIAPTDKRFSDRPEGSSRRVRSMDPGLGYNAWLWVNYWPEGHDPEVELKGLTDPDDIDYFSRQPRRVYYYDVGWDTTYGYRGPGGTGCSDLHRRFTRELGDWLDGLGADWIAKNEFTGEWGKRPMPD